MKAGQLFAWVDRIPWQITAASGVIGLLVLVRSVELNVKRARREYGRRHY